MQTFFKAFGVLWLYNQKNLLKKTFIREKNDAKRFNSFTRLI